MIEHEHMLTATEIARLAEVGSAAVSNWRKRYSDFPQSRLVGGVEMFAADEVAGWLSTRRLPKNILRPHEPVGSTYGDRFLRNSRSEDNDESAGDPMLTSPDHEAMSRLWVMLDEARGSLDAASAFDLIEALLVLKIRHPAVWRDMTYAPRLEEALPVALRRVERSRQASWSRLLTDRPREVAFDRALRSVVHVLDRVHLDDTDVAATILVLELMESLTWATGRRGDRHTPLSVLRIMTGITRPTSSDRVYDPFCRAGELLLAAALSARAHGESLDGMPLVGHAVGEREVQRTLMAAELADVEIDVRVTLPLEESVGTESAFDVVLANPPFGMSHWTVDAWQDPWRWKYGQPPSHNADFAWLQLAVEALTPGGRAAVLMGNGATFREGSTESGIRARMIEAGVVDCVIAMPPGLFASTGISVSMWVLRPPARQRTTEVLFIDATEMGSMRSRARRVLGDEDVQQIVKAYWNRGALPASRVAKIEPRVRRVGVDEIRERRYLLNPRAYVGQSGAMDLRQGRASVGALRYERARLRKRVALLDDVLEEKLQGLRAHETARIGSSHLRRVLLGDVCDVLAGPGNVARTIDRESPVRLVLPRTIRNNRLVKDKDAAFAAEPDAATKLARYRLRAGDVVCVRAGELSRTALVSSEEEGWVLGPGCMRLRPAEEVDSSYLTYYLGTPEARDWIDRNSSGSAIRSINTATLNELPLPLPPLLVQRAIGEFLAVMDEQAIVHDRLAATSAELRELVLAALGSPVTAEPSGVVEAISRLWSEDIDPRS
jgi:type I restriction enzyme M protein